VKEIKMKKLADHRLFYFMIRGIDPNYKLQLIIAEPAGDAWTHTQAHWQ